MGKSDNLFERAKKVIPGGVNSPVRAFGSVGMTPRFISNAKGARIYDADGNEVSCLRFSMIEEENAERSEENGA